MIFKQFRGPFTKDDNNQYTIKLPSQSDQGIKLSYLQVGIEHPHSIPISEFEEEEKLPDGSIQKKITYPCIISINDFQPQSPIQQYVLTERDVLEFTDISMGSLEIEILQDNPYLIVNVAYEEVTAN